jgi:hypothetical protein
MIGGLMGGYFTHTVNPFGCFRALSFIALTVAFAGFLIDKKMEMDNSQPEQ